MKFARHILAAVVAAAALTTASFAAIAKTETYSNGMFTDVQGTVWYAPYVQNTYELGLMNGVSDTTFSPSGNVTVAQAITMASRLCAANSGETIDTKTTGEWYTPYVEYAVSKGFVKEGQFDSFTRLAKRKEVAVLFATAMPKGYYSAKNNITAIPDVSEKQSYHDDLLTLYKAGILTGSDSYGNFRPEDNITRAETAAIITRAAIPEQRVEAALAKISGDDAYDLCYTPSFGAVKEGINSGWINDNRGAAPRLTLASNYSTLSDISTEAGTALIREFNKMTTGKVELFTRVTVGGYDGVYVEYQNDKGDSVYRIQTIDGNWSILGNDGKYTKIYDVGTSERAFTLDIVVDIDNNTSTTYMNDKACGTFPLSTPADKTNLLNFRFATTKEATSVIQPASVNMYVNYNAYDTFGNNFDMKFKWTGTGATGNTGNLVFTEPGTMKRDFETVSGTVAFDYLFYIPDGEATEVSLNSGEKKILNFTNDSKNFYANGEKLYENYYHNMWYRVRFEADTDAQTAVVKLNGRQIGTVDFADATTSFDNYTVTSKTNAKVYFDTFRVMRLVEHSDYVPEPVKPQGEDKYNVGMNVCSLWTNGTHFGWSCVTPFDDIEPVLGYYDEGNPETADWEIKYIVEHGIDFQAFCIYAGDGGSAQRIEANHLYNGFMNAKYSDMSKFAIIWETANAGKPRGMDDWKNNFVPYFIENYFKDPRYEVINNKPVLCIFGAGSIIKEGYLGSAANLKAAFDYLEEEVKKIGFDGMIYLACGSSSQTLADCGFDGCYAYNWGTGGSSVEINKQLMTASANAGQVYTVPTVSVGFNNVAWAGERFSLMSVEGYKEAQTWVKNEYLPTYAKEDWQKNLVMLSTWNEYGEGTYIMPASGLNGFGYLDVLREAYTDEKVDTKLDLIPTEAQKERINHLYPQYRHLLRKSGTYVATVDASSLESVQTLLYNDSSKLKYVWNVAETSFSADGISGTSQNDAIVIREVETKFDISTVSTLKVTAKATKDEHIDIFFVTEESPEWSESKRVGIDTDSDEMKEYLIDLSAKAFSGTVTALRVDPVSKSGVPFTLKSVDFLVDKDAASKSMMVDDIEVKMNFAPTKASNGDMLIAFDPSVAMDFRLNAFHVWDKASKTLTLSFVNHTVVYKVGSDKYTLDGTEKKLGYTMTDIDGLPLIPINKLCEELGYKYSIGEGNVITIETPAKEILTKRNDRTLGDWEFNDVGDTENWSSSFMSLLVSGGYMNCMSFNSSTDPTILQGTTLNLDTTKYKSLEYRVRYSYESEKTQELTMYFITNVDSNWNEEKTLKVKLNGKSSDGEWETYSVDLSEYELWKDRITKLRFDPFNATGSIDVDYIRFVPKD